MKINLYTIWDSILQESGPIYDAKNNEVAIRNFKTATKNMVPREDFELHLIGWYDAETMKGKFTTAQKIVVQWDAIDGETSKEIQES